jgi:hypothetical protein
MPDNTSRLFMRLGGAIVRLAIHRSTMSLVIDSIRLLPKTGSSW